MDHGKCECCGARDADDSEYCRACLTMFDERRAAQRELAERILEDVVARALEVGVERGRVLRLVQAA